MNTKKEGEYYSQMVRRYKNEYGGKNLQEFCIKDKGLQDLVRSNIFTNFTLCNQTRRKSMP